MAKKRTLLEGERLTPIFGEVMHVLIYRDIHIHRCFRGRGRQQQRPDAALCGPRTVLPKAAGATVRWSGGCGRSGRRRSDLAPQPSGRKRAVDIHRCFRGRGRQQQRPDAALGGPRTVLPEAAGASVLWSGGRGR